MIPEVANPIVARDLEISEEIVRFSKAGGKVTLSILIQRIYP